MRDSLAATAGMDTSDGLYDAIATLTAGCGADVDLDALPYHDIAVECSAKLDVPAFNLGLGVGDWNIVYTVDERRWRTLQGEFTDRDLELTVVGCVSDLPGIRWHEAGQARPTRAHQWSTSTSHLGWKTRAPFSPGCRRTGC